MHTRIALCLLLILPAAVRAEPIDQDAIKYIQGLQLPDGGFMPTALDPKGSDKPVASLRATSAAIRALKYLGGELQNKEKVVKFVESCFDERSGTFSDVPKGIPNVFVNAVGVMAAAELKMNAEKFIAPAVKYLMFAKGFEEVRIAAAGFEAANTFPKETVHRWLFDLGKLRNADGSYMKPEGNARLTGSAVAFILRVGGKLSDDDKKTSLRVMLAGQQVDGGYMKLDAKGSDLETTYRVMRAFHMLKEKPKDVAKLKELIDKCRNKDGGYGVAPGQPSSISGCYFASIIPHWLK